MSPTDMTAERETGDPDIRDALGGPMYIGPVAGVKQEYQVFRTARADYAVFSKSNRSATSFHMTLVPSARVEALQRLIPDEGSTSGALLKEKRVADVFGAQDRDTLYFDVLTTLYVMAALGVLEITKVGRNLVFTHAER